MLAVWYPTELLRGTQGPTDIYLVILVTVLFFLAVARIGKGISFVSHRPGERESRK